MPLKQRISSLIMLSEILPMVLIAPFHHHQEPVREDIQCESCSQHKPHSGHLTTQSSTDECLICRLLAQQFSPAETPAASAPVHARRIDTGSDCSGE
ncbi:MAG: hypothetical protein J6X25_03765 [Bacteroidales bacterium]|nr:hypothetical protein [Bacteroidales bacterium]